MHQENNKETENNKEQENLTLLGEYSYFINKIEDLREQSSSLEDVIKKVMKYCIEHGILREFLIKNEMEVMSMLLGVYDEVIEKQVVREEERAKADVRVATALIDTLLDFDYSNEKILSTLQKKLDIKEKQVG